MAVSFTKIQKISKKTSKKQQIIGPCTTPPISFFLVLFLSYQDERKRTSPNLEKTNKLPIFVAHWFATPMRGKQLKGNQVQVLNSPAAVSSIQVTSNSLIATGDQSGKAFVTGISQKTYHANKFHCFRGKSVESNEPDKSSIISFITLIQRKCVKTDKLCQVYLCVSGRRDFARTLLNNNRLKKE